MHLETILRLLTRSASSVGLNIRFLNLERSCEWHRQVIQKGAGAHQSTHLNEEECRRVSQRWC